MRLGLSAQQRALLRHDRIVGPSSTYVIFEGYRIRGEVSVPALVEALRRVQVVHPMLRARLTDPDRDPGFVFAPEPQQPVVVDMRGSPDDAIRGAILDHAARPLDAASQRLFDARVVRAEDTWVALRIHHLICDGWSIGVLRRALEGAYASAHAGAPAAPVPPQPDSSWFAERPLAADEERFWREQCAAAQSLALPRAHGATDRPIIARVRELALPADVVAAVRAAARTMRTTPYVVMLSAFQALLARFTGSRELMLGTMSSGRGERRWHECVGYFARTVPVRARIAGQMTFAALLDECSRVSRQALRHGGESMHRFDAQASGCIFVYQNIPAPPPSLRGCQVDVIPPPVVGPKTDLAVVVHDTPDEIDIRFEAHPGVAPDFVESVATALPVFVRRVATRPDTPIADALLADAASPHVPPAIELGPSEHRTLVEVFSEVARRRPEAIACRFGGEAISYAQLDHEAERVAHALRLRGVRRGDIVALCLHNGFARPAAIWGAWKAGAAFLPIDPNYPRARVREILDRARPRLVLSRAGDADEAIRSAAGHAVEVVLLDRLPEPPADSPAPPPEELDLAYVIFTSGSGGTPKGVMVAHRGLVGLARSQQQILGTTSDSVVFQFCAFGFDAYLFELIMAHAAGGVFDLGPTPRPSVGPGMLDVWRRRGVTHVTVTPSALVAIPARDCPALRCIVVAGEALPGPLVARWAPHARIVNAYGPTEGTIWTTFWVCSGQEDTPPIGHPIADTWVTLVDDDGAPVPHGAVGELCIGGRSVALGYLGDPAATAAAFVPNPFPGIPGDTLYRTGDRARRAPSGALDFLGRVDDLVKIRGHRVSLREIGAALEGHPAIKSAAVLADGGRLAAFLVFRQPDSTAAGLDEVRSWSASMLPAFMRPALWCVVETVPLTPHGKLDAVALRRRIQQVEHDAHRVRTDERAIGQLEALLAPVWRRFLGLDYELLPESRFLDLGGHSLSAVEVCQASSALLKREIDAISLLTNPTFRSWCQHVEQLSCSAAPADRVAPSGASEGPLTACQQRFWALSRLEAADPYVSAEVYEVAGPLDVDALERALGEVVALHPSLRTTFHEGATGLHQRVRATAAPRVVRFRAPDLPDPPSDDDVRALVLPFVEQPMDLATGPLFVVAAYQLSGERSLLALKTHHIVTDGLSNAILREDLARCYRSVLGHQVQNDRREPPLGCIDFAELERATREPRWRGDALRFWLERLADAPTSPPLPFEQTVPRASPGHRAFALSERETAALLDTAHEHHVTLFMLTYAAVYVALRALSGRDDISVGTVMIDRPGAFERVVGPFIGTVVLRHQSPPEAPVLDVLASVRATVLDALAHADLPFDHLIRALSPHQRGRDQSLYSVWFDLEQGTRTPLALVGATVRARELGPLGRAKSPLSIRCRLDDGRLWCTVEVRPDRYSETTLERVQRVFHEVLRILPGALRTPLHELELASALQRVGPHQPAAAPPALFAPSAGPSAGIDPFARLASLAEQFPHRIAVEDGDGVVLSFAELRHAAEELARALAERSVGRGHPVPFVLGRTCRAVVAIFAAWRLRCPYVPLDPAWPEARLATILDTLSPRAVVVDGASAHLVSADRAAHVDALEQRRDRSDDAPLGDTPSPFGPLEPVYIMFTSGSTGVPRGVVVSARGLAALDRGLRERIALDPPADRPLRVSLNGPLSFDTTIKQLLRILDGHTLVLVPEPVRRSPLRWMQYLRDRRIDVLDCTPSQLEMLDVLSPIADYPWFPGTVLVGGEAIARPLWRTLRARPERFYNVYGPTECTADVTVARIATASDEPTLGRPLPEVQLEIWDPAQRALPAGEPGEIVVRGPQVGLGYLARSGGSVETHPGERPAFLRAHDPDGAAPVYFTGDRGVLRDDGTLVFLGRDDDEVKVRGHRVSLSEVNAVFSQLPGVRAAVTQVEGSALWTYVIPATGAVQASELLARSRDRLPAFAVPAGVSLVDRLPLTGSGKLDRDALRQYKGQAFAPEHVDPRDGPWDGPWDGPTAEPRDELENELLALAAALLPDGSMAIDRDFFAIGGDSVTAIRFLASVERCFQIRLDVDGFFAQPTIRWLATTMRTRHPEIEGSRWRLLGAGDASAAVCAVHPVGGEVACYISLGKLLSRPIYAVAAREGDDPATLREMASRYITSLEAPTPDVVLGWSFGGLLALEMARQLQAAGRGAPHVLLIDSFAPPEGEAPLDDAALEDAFWRHQNALMHPHSVDPARLGEDAVWRRRARVYRANARAMATFERTAYPGPASLLIAGAGRSPAEIAAQADSLSGFLGERLSVDVVDGASHFTILRAPHCERVAAWIEARTTPKEL